jgi:hypothetical protein
MIRRCSGCGIGETAEPQTTKLEEVLGWHADGRPALLCRHCLRCLRRNRGRARYNKPRPSDHHMTGRGARA